MDDQQETRTGTIPEKDPALLDIHEAAQFLRVSEVTVRRYTNSGALPCLRVGGRRQRRFRRADLEAFLHGPAPEDAPEAPARHAQTPECPEAPADRLLLEGLEIPYGSHLCQLYETDRGRLQMATPFILDGLAAGDACFIVAAEKSRAHLLSAFRSMKGDLDTDLAAARLCLLDCARSGEEMIERLDLAFSAALGAGYRRLRLLGDMAWFLDMGLSARDLTDFELRYDRMLGHSYPVVSLCLYDARRFSGVEVLHTLKCHTDTFDQPLSRFLLR